MDSWQEEQLHSLLNAGSESDLFNALAKCAAKLGFESCSYGLRAPLPVSSPKVVLLNNYSASWQESYVRNNYLMIDPTVAHGMRSVLPLVWSDSIFASCRGFWEDAQSHGLRVGWAQSCHDARGIGSLLTLARPHDELSGAELAENTLKMSWLSKLSHEGLSHLLLNKLIPESGVTLTARERDVMLWTAEGKTSSDVGDIMNISDSTVNFHINNAVRKLGACNKTAASIKAVVLRLI
jgi:LuxR family transcriptional regulator